MKLDVQRPGKELWPGVTKADLAHHLRAMAPRMLPHLANRPLTLVRAPDGMDGPRFFQKNAHHLAKHLETCTYGGVDYVLVDDEEDLVRLADQATLEVHGWTSLCAQPDKPDRLVFDLDPPDQAHFTHVREAAKNLCGLLERRGATPHVMLTGSKGIHVVVPLRPDAGYDDVQAFTTAVAQVLVQRDDHLSLQLRKDRRKGRIFMDTLRNRPRQTSVMPWSPRARAGAPFACPIPVADLDDPGLDPRMARLGTDPSDPWDGFFEAAIPLSALTGQ